MINQHKSSSLLKVALIITTLLFAETSYATSGNASIGHFSQKQITTFVKTVTTEMELSKNWKSSFANTAGSKLYCNSVVLGQGVRAGSYGLYTWFTCSAMHRLDTTQDPTTHLKCTGFSSPVWIQPSAASINFQAVAFGPDYTAFRTSAPREIRTIMDATFSELNSGQPRIVVARASQGSSMTKSTNQTGTCQ